MLSSKIKTLLTDGLDPYLEGKHNFNNPVEEVEALAKERAKICIGCRYFKTEPIEMFRVVDERIPELTNKSCGLCGCIESYKLRQSIKVCKKWANL